MQLGGDSLKVNQNKAKKVALGVLTATMVVSPMSSLAQSGNGNGKQQEVKGQQNQEKKQVQHAVPLLNAPMGLVAPDAAVKFAVDQSDKGYKSVRQQLENGSFLVMLVSDAGERSVHAASYQDGVITLDTHKDFERYTAYTATVLVKSDYQQALQGTLPAVDFGDGVAFQTGSGVGEATTVKAELVDASVSVEEKAVLQIEVTDDYGNPATDATVIVTGTGEGNEKVDSTFTEPIVVEVKDGKAEVEISDQSANDVTLTYEVIDNQYKDSETETGSTVVEFTPGQTETVELDMPDTIVAGEEYTITGEAEDRFGNSVEDGTAFDVNSDVGTVENETVTEDGEFSFDYEAPTKVGNGDITIVGDGFEYEFGDVIVVTPSTPENVIVTLPPTVNAGENVPVSGTVEDQYGNPIANTPVEIEGALNGTVTTDEDGNFSTTLTPGASGDVTATVGGQTVTITTPGGTPVTSVNVVSATPTKVTMSKPSTVESGKYYTVSGTLLDQNGQPIANKSVTFTGALSGTVTTNANGQYSGSLRANSTGTVTAKVGTTTVAITTPTGSAITTVTVSAPAPVVGTIPSKISLNASGYSTITISGKVTDSSGRPVPNAKVSLQKSYYGDFWSSGTLQTAYTDANGDYRFSIRGSGIMVFVKTDNNSKSRIVYLEYGMRDNQL